MLDGVMSKRPNAEAFALDARLRFAEGKYDDALRSARAALELDKRQTSAQYVIGTIEFSRGRYAEAEHAYRDILQQNPNAADAKLQLARTRLAAGHPGDAIELAAAAGPATPARLTYARALIADGQTDRARVELAALETSGESAEAATLLGSLDLDRGDVSSARARAAHALALAPDSVDALLLSAKAALAADDSPAAEQYLKRAIARDPASFEPSAMLAQTYVARGDLEHARTTLEALVARNPQSAPARSALGLVLQDAGRARDARSAFEQAIALDPTEPLAAVNLARIYAGDEQKAESAIRLAEIASTKLPDDPEPHDALGWAYYKTGRLRSAAHELELAVSMNPREPLYRQRLDEVRRAITEAENGAR
jgi:tetratricopeptide (TPR) repeat protein